ncbi:hypothetical protein ACFXKJ_29915 [Kitasatospora indigofera]|uniref:hypothetical protein n=1 Tax=Kitasatospora indigofera TaxID=67307 RepID=UPI003674AE8A
MYDATSAPEPAPDRSGRPGCPACWRHSGASLQQIDVPHWRRLFTQDRLTWGEDHTTGRFPMLS